MKADLEQNRDRLTRYHARLGELIKLAETPIPLERMPEGFAGIEGAWREILAKGVTAFNSFGKCGGLNSEPDFVALFFASFETGMGILEAYTRVRDAVVGYALEHRLTMEESRAQYEEAWVEFESYRSAIDRMFLLPAVKTSRTSNN